ncbi:MAG TPA: bifunctional DNA primase/polymerase [Bosea sp. (in: a-proteobacteria)]
MADDSLRSQAVALASKGFRVFPLLPNGKTPAVEGGVYQASSDPERVHRFWSEALSGEALDYNIGIATGGGLLVVDVDNKNGKNGALSLESLELRNSDLPVSLTVRTPTNGNHVYLTVPGGTYVRNSASHLGDGLDIRGDGGYVVAPGSVISGMHYTITVDAPSAEVPGWLLPMVSGPRPVKAESVEALEGVDEDIAAARAGEWLKKHAELSKEGDGGDAAAYRVAARVMDFGLSPSDALDVMLVDWNERCEPPWEPERLEVIVNNAAAYRHSPIGSSSADVEFQHEEIDERLVVGTADGSEAGADEWPKPTPLEDFDPHAIPPREWIVPALLARTFVTALISPGGTGKTQFAASIGLALSAGRSDILGFDVPKRAKVWYWNQEDDQDELRRRIGAVREHHGISTADTLIDGDPGFFYDSGVERPLIMAKRKPDGSLATTANVPKIIEQIKRNQIDVFIADPFIEFHEGEENNNAEMAATWRIFRRIAVETRCAVFVSAHTKKPPDADAESFIGSMDSLRGASAQGPVVRLAYTLFTMTNKNAKLYGVPENQRHLYARLDRAKGNIFIDNGEPRWFRRESVHLGPPDAGESLGVLLPATLEKGGAGGETDPLYIIAQALDDNADFEDGQWYGLAEIVASMDAPQVAALGSGKNLSRTIERAVKAHGIDVEEREEKNTVTDYGVLGIWKKPKPGGFVFYIKRAGLK